MFDRFSAAARSAVITAHEQARAFGQDVGPEHLLLGLICEQEGVAARALDSYGGSLATVRRQVEEILAGERQPPDKHAVFTSSSKMIFKLSLSEAERSGHTTVGTGHILLSLIWENNEIIAQIMARLGVEPSRFERTLIERMRNEKEEHAFAGARSHLRADLQGRTGYATIERASNSANVMQLHAEVSRLQSMLRHYNIDPCADDRDIRQRQPDKDSDQ